MYNSIRVYNHSGIKNLCFFSIHAHSFSEEIDLWKNKSQMKDMDLSRTREELSVTLTDIKRKEGTCNNESTIIVACVFKEFNLILITLSMILALFHFCKSVYLFY